MSDKDLTIALDIPNDKEVILSLIAVSIEHIRSWQYLNSLHYQVGQPLPLDVFMINYDLNNNQELFYQLLPYVKHIKSSIEDLTINKDNYECLTFIQKVNVFISTIKSFAKIIEETQIPYIYKQIDLPTVEKIQQAYKDSGLSITSFADAFTI